MYRLSSIVALLILTWQVMAQSASPHGEALKLDCAGCHASEDWTTLRTEVLFDHDTTAFPLEGSHDAVDCKGCHQSLIFSDVSLDCAGCHTDIHSNTVGNDCARCHTPVSWLVDHIPEIHEMNGFPLAGSHSTLNCAECHLSEVNLRFDRLGNDCYSCHATDYANTTAPNHLSAGYSTECMQCHDIFGFGWRAEQIDHSFFPLQGGHDIQDCTQCHQTENYANISAECVSCHLEDYNRTTNPNHVASNFDTDCTHCHTIQDWTATNFDHSSWPLLGAHTSVDCNSCHQGDYANTPNTCVGCHLDDYNRTNDPDHASAGFSIDCLTCHDETAWEPSTFDHDASYFPIYSGTHRGEWNQCTDCHIQANNYAVFSCIDCHEHSNKRRVDNDHDDVSGYVYSSTSCFDCHPNGTED